MEGLPETAAPGRTATHRQPSAPGAEPVPWARTAADLLTLSRLAVGVGLALWPWQPSLRSLAALFRWKMALWTADAADGALARWSRTPPSWIGRQDIWLDTVITLSAGVALARMGFLPAAGLAAWTAACAAAYALRPVETVLLVFMLPLHLSVVVLAAAHRLPEAWVFLAWVVVMAVLGRRRLTQVIGLFIGGLPDGPRRWVLSWLPAVLRAEPDHAGPEADAGGPRGIRAAPGERDRE